MNNNQLHIKRSKDIERSLTAPRYVGKQELLLAIVLSYEAIDAGNARYKYKITPAMAITDPISALYGLAVERHDVGKDVHIEYDAFSISEMGNTGTYVSYGVSLANLPANVNPVPIPEGTPVVAMANRGNDGTYHYIIINTQALSGTC